VVDLSLAFITVLQQAAIVGLDVKNVVYYRGGQNTTKIYSKSYIKKAGLNGILFGNTLFEFPLFSSVPP
jgi:hypothetical protein